jgi:hypothetical protein
MPSRAPHLARSGNRTNRTRACSSPRRRPEPSSSPLWTFSAPTSIDLGLDVDAGGLVSVYLKYGSAAASSVSVPPGTQSFFLLWRASKSAFDVYADGVLYGSLPGSYDLAGPTQGLTIKVYGWIADAAIWDHVPRDQEPAFSLDRFKAGQPLHRGPDRVGSRGHLAKRAVRQRPSSSTRSNTCGTRSTRSRMTHGRVIRRARRATRRQAMRSRSTP